MNAAIANTVRPPAPRPVLRAAAAVLTAVAINAAIFWFLAALNSRPVPDQMPPPPVRTLVLSSNRPEPTPPTEQQKPEPKKQTEPMTVNLDVRMPQPEVQPLDLSLDLPEPSIAPVRIAVHTPKPAPPRPAPPAPTPAPSKPSRPAAPSGPMDAERVDQPPREHANNPQPTYPPRERRIGIEGDVVVKLLIDETGRVEKVEPVSGRSGFTRAVLDVVRRWRFEPARHQGRRVKVWGVKTIRFQLVN